MSGTGKTKSFYVYKNKKKYKIKKIEKIKKYKIGVNYDEIKRRAKERKIKKRTC